MAGRAVMRPAGSVRKLQAPLDLNSRLTLPPLRVVHRTSPRHTRKNTHELYLRQRADENLGDDFSLNLPLDLEKLTFGFTFNSPVDGVEVGWPPGLTVLHFGMAFNPRPPTAAAAAIGIAAGTTRSRPPPAPSTSSSGEGSEVGWAKFLAPTLEEIVFGGHFNQPVVSERERRRGGWRGRGGDARRLGRGVEGGKKEQKEREGKEGLRDKQGHSIVVRTFRGRRRPERGGAMDASQPCRRRDGGGGKRVALELVLSFVS